jgi:hypothetical protein
MVINLKSSNTRAKLLDQLGGFCILKNIFFFRVSHSHWTAENLGGI